MHRLCLTQVYVMLATIVSVGIDYGQTKWSNDHTDLSGCNDLQFLRNHNKNYSLKCMFLT